MGGRRRRKKKTRKKRRKGKKASLQFLLWYIVISGEKFEIGETLFAIITRCFSRRPTKAMFSGL